MSTPIPVRGEPSHLRTPGRGEYWGRKHGARPEAANGGAGKIASYDRGARFHTIIARSRALRVTTKPVCVRRTGRQSHHTVRVVGKLLPSLMPAHPLRARNPPQPHPHAQRRRRTVLHNYECCAPRTPCAARPVPPMHRGDIVNNFTMLALPKFSLVRLGRDSAKNCFAPRFFLLHVPPPAL